MGWLPADDHWPSSAFKRCVLQGLWWRHHLHGRGGNRCSSCDRVRGRGGPFVGCGARRSLKPTPLARLSPMSWVTMRRFARFWFLYRCSDAPRHTKVIQISRQRREGGHSQVTPCGASEGLPSMLIPADDQRVAVSTLVFPASLRWPARPIVRFALPVERPYLVALATSLAAS